MMSYAVLRLRGSKNKSKKVLDTLDMLRLRKVNHCTIVPEEDHYEGMLNKVKDMVTWGEIEKMSLGRLILLRSGLDKKSVKKRVEDETQYESVMDFAGAVAKGESSMDSIPDLDNLFRLHPPRGGYRSVKKPYNSGGSLGYRGQAINDLLVKMLGPEYSSGD